MLSMKKIELLEIAGRIEIGYSRDYAILSEAHEYTAVRKRLGQLCSEGLMQEDWRNGKKVYCLSAAGLTQIETHMKKVYNPGGQTTDHALIVADFAAYICLKNNLSHESVIFDRDMEYREELKPIRYFGPKKERNIQKVHAPDFIIGSVCFEVELTQKSKSRLRENFKHNADYFSKQVWLVPTRLKSLRTSLRKLSEEYKCPVAIYNLEKLEENLRYIDLVRPCKGKTVTVKLKEPTSRDILEDLR